jgi:hypothetical protein
VATAAGPAASAAISELAVRADPDPDADSLAASAAPCASALPWRRAKRGDLDAALRRYGAAAAALGRMIVMQQREAVAEAGSPQGLARLVENAIGGGPLREEIAALAAALAEQREEEEGLSAALEEKELRRGALDGAVGKYERFKAVEAEHAQRAAEVLAQHASMLRRHAAAASPQRSVPAVH